MEVNHNNNHRNKDPSNLNNKSNSSNSKNHRSSNRPMLKLNPLLNSFKSKLPMVLNPQVPLRDNLPSQKMMHNLQLRRKVKRILWRKKALK